MIPSAAVISGVPTFDGTEATPPSSLISLTTNDPTPKGDGTSQTTYQELSIPAKLQKRIQDLEFIEMAEFLPDSWRLQDDDSSKCCQTRRTPKRGPVNDIMVWTECYSALVAVLSAKFPWCTPHLMAYQRTIVKAHRTFVGEGWILYDTCYRRKAAITKSLKWGEIDFTLYNETFTGRAKALVRCNFCASELHASQECVYAPVQNIPAGSNTRPWTRQTTGNQATSVCQLFNGRTSNRCTFNPCKFAHICSDCRGRHPVSACRRGSRPQAGNRHRSRSPKK